MRRARRLAIGSGPVAGVLVALGVVTLAVTGCVDPKPSSPTPEDLEEVDLSPDHEMVVDDGGFRPDELDVTSGDVVRLVNEGTGPHSFSAPERFDTGRLEPGDDVTLVLTDPGVVEITDVENADASATITVAEGEP